MPITIEEMKVYDVRELSKIVGVTPITVRKYITTGKLRGQKDGLKIYSNL